MRSYHSVRDCRKPIINLCSCVHASVSFCQGLSWSINFCMCMRPYHSVRDCRELNLLFICVYVRVCPWVIDSGSASYAFLWQLASFIFLLLVPTAVFNVLCALLLRFISTQEWIYNFVCDFRPASQPLYKSILSCGTRRPASATVRYTLHVWRVSRPSRAVRYWTTGDGWSVGGTCAEESEWWSGLARDELFERVWWVWRGAARSP